MGTDDIFKKKREKLERRKKELKDPTPNSFLIVSEGTKTEPYYFDGLAKYINEKYGNGVDVEKPLIDTSGEGRCTVSLVEETEKIVACSKIIYSQIWVVFDKDDFNDFDDAIELGKRKGYNIAWSNQSFEYWIYLHFNFSDSALHRDDWVKKLDTIFKDYKIDENGYEKNNSDIFNIATTKGSLKFAIQSAFRINDNYDSSQKPSQCDPCTNVHRLVLELEPYISELLL